MGSRLGRPAATEFFAAGRVRGIADEADIARRASCPGRSETYLEGNTLPGGHGDWKYNPAHRVSFSAPVGRHYLDPGIAGGQGRRLGYFLAHRHPAEAQAGRSHGEFTGSRVLGTSTRADASSTATNRN